MNGAHRCGGEPLGRLCVHGMGHDAGDGRKTVLTRRAFAHEHQGRRAVGDARRGSRSDRAIFFERRLEPGDFVQLGFEGLLVKFDDRVTGLACQRNRGNFPFEAAVFIGELAALGGCDGELVLRFSGELVLGHALLGKHAHGLAAVVRVFQPVERHMVKQSGGAIFDALACKRQVGRIRHAFHAARNHHFGTARRQHVVAKHGGAHARAAHFGEGHGAHAVGQTGAAHGLARGRLPLARHQAIAKQNFIDGVQRHARTLDRRLHRNRAQLPRRQR